MSNTNLNRSHNFVLKRLLGRCDVSHVDEEKRAGKRRRRKSESLCLLAGSARLG